MQQEISTPPVDPRDAWSLAIEVIGRSGSLAVLHGGRVRAACNLPAGERATSSLTPAIASLAAEHLPGGSLESLSMIAVASGPGSFTGLRIAVTTAKTLAFALPCPLVAVNSLAAIASLVTDHSPAASPNDEASPLRRSVLIGLAAYRGQVYRGIFSTNQTAEIEVVSATQWQADVMAAAEKSFVFSGDRSVFDRPGITIDPETWRNEASVRAIGVGHVGAALFARGQTTPAMDLVPEYLRPSAAEE